MPGNPFYQSTFWRDLRSRRLKLDGYCCAVPGCGQRARFVDHVEARPFVPHPCDADRLDNLRSLCAGHDAQVKEQRRGQAARRNGGRFTVRGSDVDGWPLDPTRRDGSEHG
jgi:hypothetical protein